MYTTLPQGLKIEVPKGMPKVDVVIQKRDALSERHTTTKRQSWMPTIYGDRFIPRRTQLPHIERNENIISKKHFKDILIPTSDLQRNQFVQLLHDAFAIEPGRLLNFSDATDASETPPSEAIKSYYRRLIDADWPCKPRTKPMAMLEKSHRLPMHTGYFAPAGMDWSVRDYIATSVRQMLMIWDLKTKDTTIYKVGLTYCCAFAPNGVMLAVACRVWDQPYLQLWNTEDFQRIYVLNSVNLIFLADILCLTWSRCGQRIVCGLNNGRIYIISAPNLRIMHVLEEHRNVSIRALKFSPAANYLGTVDEQGVVIIYNWNNYEPQMIVRPKRRFKVCFDWHPWRESEIVISEDCPASIVLMNVARNEVLCYYQRRDADISIDYITFNKITSELAVSIQREIYVDGETELMHHIVVLASLDRIVDTLHGDCGARFMLWSPTGTQLLATTADSTLSIWNFLDAHQCKSQQQQQHSLKSAANRIETHFGEQFKMWQDCTR